MLIRFLAVWGVAAFACTSGCREQEPPPKYNRAMSDSDSGSRLLPIARTVAGSRDDSILRDAQATIIRRDEIDSPEAAAMVSGESPHTPIEITQATSPSEAFGNVGKMFMNSLMNPDSEPPGGGASPSGGDSSGGASAGGSGGDADVQSVLSEYAEELVAGQYMKLASFCAKDQKGQATEYFEILDEMNTSVSSLLAAYEKSSPGAKVKFEKMLSGKRAAFNIGGVSMDGANAAVVATTPGGKSVTLSMVDEDGSWRLVHPVIDAASDWSAFKDELETHIESLDDEVDEISSGGPADNSKLDKLIEKAIIYLAAMP